MIIDISHVINLIKKYNCCLVLKCRLIQYIHEFMSTLYINDIIAMSEPREIANK